MAATNYYQSVNCWLGARPRTREHAGDCLSSAVTYRHILDELLDFLEAMPPTEILAGAISRAEKHRGLLNDDMRRGYCV